MKKEEDAKKEKDAKKEEKVDEATKTDKPWTDMKGNKHPGTAVKGDKYTGKEAEKEEKPKSKKDESVEPQFKSKFMKMVEAKKAEAADKKKADKKKKMEEAMDPVGRDDDDVKKEGKGDGNLANNAKPYDKVTQGDVVAGRLGKDAKGGKKDAKVKESAMMPKGKKRPVKESVESNLSFKEMMALVVESGGQQQIDPVDNQLWAWAQRVAKTKIGEGMKADIYAGMVYERMGGAFEMYDVLSEDRR
jgi:hypothetical protein